MKQAYSNKPPFYVHLFALSLSDTTKVKGIALLLLLWHHLFFAGGLQYTEYFIGSIPVIQQSASAAKVCVALFVLLSGYGLAIQAQKNPLPYTSFLKKRLRKLFVNYWMMWLLFVPIGFLFFGWTLQGIYGEHSWQKLIVDIMGLQCALGLPGVNPTWWFYSLIILLYLAFPLLNHLSNSRAGSFCLLVVSGVYMIMPFSPNVASIKYYLPCFIMGIMLARHLSNIELKFTPPLYENSKHIVTIDCGHYIGVLEAIRSYPHRDDA